MHNLATLRIPRFPATFCPFAEPTARPKRLAPDSTAGYVSNSIDLDDADHPRVDPTPRPLVGGQVRASMAASRGELAGFETGAPTDRPP